jgi:hypothetical protein
MCRSSSSSIARPESKDEARRHTISAVVKTPTALLVAAVAVALLAVAWGLGAFLWVLFPGGSGEWTALAEPAAYVVDIPVGVAVVALAAGSAPRAPRVRRTAIVAGTAAMLLPLLVSLVRHVGPWR